VVLNSLKSLNLTDVYPNNNNNNNNNKVQGKPLELYELAGKNMLSIAIISGIIWVNKSLSMICLKFQVLFILH
jgi:hypothetical protein